MHLKNDINIIKFLTEIKKCKGEVFFETPDGDSLSLKSALSQYIFCSIINEPELLSEGIIRFEDETDSSTLRSYLK